MDSNWYELFLRIRTGYSTESKANRQVRACSWMRTGYSTGDKYKIDRRKLLLDRASHLSEQKQIDGYKLFLVLN
uniref:Uncharacterized protein n=1 Tax=Medicago truncatula TaxID=3880 RepID=A2Q2J7_MEDTR|nr:hypothetical protein MtrDRAFT_AC150891g52v2 [Medicago truncatula]